MQERPTREQYARAQRFINVELRSVKKHLTPQQLNALRGQALDGDIEGAQNELLKLMGRKSE